VALPGWLMPRLKYAPEGPRPWMMERGLRRTATLIRGLSPGAPLILAHLPTRSEIESATPAPLVRRLRADMPGVRWASTLEPLVRLRGNRPTTEWFVPNNSHVSDAGARAYAEAVHAALRPHLAAQLSASVQSAVTATEPGRARNTQPLRAAR
jgi:hypothetical protein